MKNIFILFSFIFFSFAAFALPGVKPYLSDTSGEYVYYRDYTFEDEALVGFIYYDDSTYAARFYSKLKDITIYVTVNPSKDYVEFTGEKVTGGSVVDDADIINYLHDLIYEFSARRKNVPELKDEPITDQQEYEQFGGTVNMTFNSYVPVFNVESISAIDGKKMLQVETVGLVRSSSDTSFSAFKGADGLPKDKKRVLKKSKAKKVTAVFDDQTLMLDEGWNQSMENLWVLGDNALITFTKIPYIPSVPDRKYMRQILVRKMCQGTVHSYSVWPQKKIEYGEKSTKVMSVYYQDDTQNVTRDFKILTETESGMALFTITVFEGAYQSNKKYFDSIIKSYKVE